MKTLKYKVALVIFKFLNFVFSAHIVIFKLAVACLVQLLAALNLRVEHVCTQIQNRPFVNFIIFVLASRFLAELLDKCTDLVTKLALRLADVAVVLF